MIALVEGAARQKTPNEIALHILLVGLTIVFLFACVTLVPLGGVLGHRACRRPVIVALLVCLIPTTIGGLLSAIGIAGMDRLLQKNVIAMSGRAVEAAGDVDMLLLDKTGTITLGNRMAHRAARRSTACASRSWPRPRSWPASPTRRPRAARSSRSSRTSYGVAGAPTARDGTFIPFTAQTRMSGVDLGGARRPQGRGRRGRRASSRRRAARCPRELRQHRQRASATPAARRSRSRDGARVLGIIHLKDIVKAGIAERFARFRAMGIRTVMITGDNPRTAAAIAKEAGVDDFLAEATPEAKMRLIKDEQAKGKLVAMTGDGTNDAPALAQADVGVAMNTGTQAAKEAGNMVDLDSNPTKLLEVVEVGKQLLMTRGTLTTFSIANDVAKYFAILPAMFMGVFPEIAPLNVMHLASPLSAHPVGGHLQRDHHHPAHPARAARREVPAARRRRDPAALAAHLRRRRRHRAVRRHQAHRPGPRGPASSSERSSRSSRHAQGHRHRLRVTLVTLVLTGFIYPLAMTGVAQVLFPRPRQRQPRPRREGRRRRLGAHRPGVRAARRTCRGARRRPATATTRRRPRARTSARRRRSCAIAWPATSSGCTRRTPTRRAGPGRAGHDVGERPRPRSLARGGALAGAAHRAARARSTPERVRAVIEQPRRRAATSASSASRASTCSRVNLALDQQFGKPTPLAPPAAAPSALQVTK